MARTHRLTPLAVKNTRKLGLHADGLNLYLQVRPAADGGVTKSWIFRYRNGDRLTDMGLGPAHTITLAEARQKALELRKLKLEGIDPLEHKRALQHSAKPKRLTFAQCADRYIEAHRSGWKNGKHAAQWESTLSAYAYPVFGDRPVDEVDLPAVLEVLEPIWQTKTETASRLRGRIERILDWATVRKHRSGENPARWRGHLQALLPMRSKVAPVRHFAALPYPEMPAFMEKLRTHTESAARALEFQILTAARPGETRSATWDEINLDARVWTIPAERMKAGKEHRVPLSDAAVAVLTEMQKHGTEGFVFPGGHYGKPVSDVAVKNVLKRCGQPDVTAHGMRSTFRDWAAERTSYPHEVCEMALAHVIGNKAEAAYRRGDVIKKRTRMMQDWADYCATPAAAGDVVPMRERTA